nr:retrotransposon protein, putative, Ty1-copia subclass [Tanacetum cinerariifolium]
QLRIVLSIKDRLNYLEHPIPDTSVLAYASQQVAPKALAAHAAWELKTLFSQQAEQELLQTMREFHSCKQEEGRSVTSYVLKIKSYIDNLERFGHHVSLGLRHKHEVFETFEVFQKEVENQLGRIIKSLRSDRGDEYMSQDFLDHLKDHGIIAHHTPPYTPQHNGVSERRNRTLLDMGCEELVKRDTLTKPDKLKPMSIKCIFIGYPKKTMGYYFYYPPENKVLVARNVEFLKNSLITQEASRILEDLKIIQEEDTSYVLYIDAEEHKLGDLGKPANYKAALLDPESDKWLNAMNAEIQYMKDNEVWDLVDLPPNGKTAGSKWLFKKKTNMDRAIHTYKAHVVEKGYNQTSWIDYEETFSPVADIKANMILITINITSRFQQNPDDLKSQTGYVFLVNGGAIDWKSVKQSIFTTLFAEAGYIASYDASKEAAWVRKFIFRLGVVPTIEEPINMYCDNTGAITIDNESSVTKGS